MKKLFSLIVILMLAIGVSAAQDNSVFLGASFTHNGDLPKTVKGALGTLTSGVNIGGADLGLSAKLAGPLGLAFDGNFSHSATNNQFMFLAGPEVSIRPKNNRLFAHALIGGAYETQKIKGFTAVALADSSFAYELGGGFEKFFGKHVGARVGLDYIYTDAFHSGDSNLKATAGLVVRF
jgi:hypothetical protein